MANVMGRKKDSHKTRDKVVMLNFQALTIGLLAGLLPKPHDAPIISM